MHTSCHGLKLLNLHAQEGGLDPLVNKIIPWIPSWKFLEDHNIPGYCNLYTLLSTNILSIS